MAGKRRLNLEACRTALMLKNIFFVSFIAMICSCASLTKEFLKDPDVQVTNVEVAQVNLQDLTLLVKMKIKNPNAMALSLGKVTYALQFSGQKVTEGFFDKGVEIPAAGEGEVILPLKFSYNSVNSLIEGFMKKSLTKEYELNGTAQFGLFSIPFRQKGELKIEK